MLQKAQKPQSKGMTAVPNEAKVKAISNTMQVLSDRLLLLSDASHEIDLRRRALFKSDMKSEY